MMFVGALVVFFRAPSTHNRSSQSLDNLSYPRISIENLSVFRYSGNTLNSMVISQEANLYEPNLLILKGNIFAESYEADGETENLQANTVTSLFKANDLSEIMAGSKIDRIIFQDDVKFNVSNMLIRTQQAIFNPETEYLSSKQEVFVDGPGRSSRADEGFTLNLQQERLRMRGQVTGVFN